MVELSVIRDLVAIAGAIIALTYYIINIKSQRESREASLFNSIHHTLLNQDRWDTAWELHLEWQYTDYDDRARGVQVKPSANLS